MYVNSFSVHKDKMSTKTGILIFFMVAVSGCGLDVSFEEQNRDALATYDPSPMVSEPEVAEPEVAEPEDEEVLESFSHAAWMGVLGRYLKGSCVEYEDLRASPEALAQLALYEGQLRRANLEANWSEEEWVVFWVNAYNGLTVLGVVDERLNDPDFRVDNGGFVFFQQRRWNVGGFMVSLDMIEHGILRGDEAHQSFTAQDEETREMILAQHALAGDFDPRLHFALNCASRSCPDLRFEIYQSDKLEAQLTEQSEIFLNDASKGAGPQGVSSLFDWFRADFETVAPVADFIATYRDNGIEGVDTGTFLTYDWAPNDFAEDLAICQSGTVE